MKKPLLLLPLMLISLASCADASSSNSVPTSISGSENSENAPSVDVDVFAYEAATSIGLLYEYAEPMKLARASDELIKTIQDYLPSVEASLNGDDILSNSQFVNSDREEYKYQLIVSYSDILNNNYSFTMYFNEYIMPSDDFDEEESYIEGLIVIGEDEFRMRGEKEREDDEIEASFTCFLNDSSYIRVKQEKEFGESEFEYELYQNRRLVKYYSIESEGNEVELNSASLGENIHLEFTFLERQGKTYISCYVVSLNERDHLLFEKIVESDGTITYQLVTI